MPSATFLENVTADEAPAAMVPGSKLMDAAPHHQTMADVLAIANDYELFILHTSTPSLVTCRSCSTQPASCCTASSNDGIVFSGAYAEAPR